MSETGTVGAGRSGRRTIGTIVAGVVLVNLVGAAPAVLSGPGSAWFQSLAKPSIYPPGWLFGVVWTLLFTLAGVALALVWLADEGRARRVALGLFAGQMVLNVAWTPAFFAAENLLAGLVVIVALWPALLATIVAFDRVDRRAALLLVPYLAWVTFAAVLNYQFWRLN
ncbi:TspO/MBR family protein [Halosimplex salinum]|uniref:TspO/MBR family protein n=1 Tax=Halosimplex salinum TaxID=1710538 RepID=UPI000F46CDF9|nr:TspO/MBR family protein [Halosimplex salinum]